MDDWMGNSADMFAGRVGKRAALLNEQMNGLVEGCMGKRMNNY
jgi:hypothetical protein